jgi:hypothetical protein
MIYRIVGVDSATQQPVDLHWEADDLKAARKIATEAGVEVWKVEPLDQPDTENASAPEGLREHTKPPSLLGNLVAVSAIVGIVVFAGYCYDRYLSHQLATMTTTFRDQQMSRRDAEHAEKLAEIEKQYVKNQATVARWKAFVQKEIVRRQEWEADYEAARDALRAQEASGRVSASTFDEAERLILASAAEKSRRNAFDAEYITPYLPNTR